MTTTKRKVKQKAIKFDEYKSIKDDIIEISEQRFTNSLSEFEKRIFSKFDSMGTDFDRKLDSGIESVGKEFRWLIGLQFVFLTVLMTLYKFIQ